MGKSLFCLVIYTKICYLFQLERELAEMELEILRLKALRKYEDATHRNNMADFT